MYMYVCHDVPEVPRRRRPVLVRRRVVRRACRQEVATGNLRDPRELATGLHLHHPCPPGCLSPTQVVAGPADPIVGPSPRPAGPVPAAGPAAHKRHQLIGSAGGLAILASQIGQKCPTMLAKGGFGSFH